MITTIQTTRGGQKEAAMHKVSKALLLFSFSFLLIFNSCTNLFENSVDNQNQNTQTADSAGQTPDETSTPAPIPKITFGGSLRVEGALPSGLQQVLANPEEATIAPLANDDSRTARPTISTGTNYEYYVRAYTDDGAQPVETIPQLVEGAYTYSLALELEHTWKFEAGFRRKAVGEDPVRQLLIDYESKTNNPFSINLHTASGSSYYGEQHVFTLCPSQSENGKGSINLLMDVTGADNVTVTAVDEAGVAQTWTGNNTVNLLAPSNPPGPGSWYIRSTGVDTADSEATVHHVKSGTYELTLTFYKNYSITGVNDPIPIPVYTTYQTVNVFDNMTTDTWVNENATVSGITPVISSSGAFSVTSAMVDASVERTIYVGVSDSIHEQIPTLTANDNYTGAPYAPLATLTRAFNKIQARGNGGPYKIYVSGNQTGNFKIPSGISTSNASSIEIRKAAGSTSAQLSGAGSSVLKIESAVPVTISNLRITAGLGDENGNGGGLNIGSSAKVTLGDGAIIGDDTASEIAYDQGHHSNSATCGGGIYCEGELTLKSGSRVCYNYSDSTESDKGGGGIYCKGGSVNVLRGAEISKNGSNYGGGGIYLADNATVTLGNGSKVSQNESNIGGGLLVDASSTLKLEGGLIGGSTDEEWNLADEGGAVYVMQNGTFEINGNSLITEGSANYHENDVYLANSKITVTGSLSQTNVATITPESWSRGTQVLAAGGSLSSVESVASKFKVSDVDFSVNKLGIDNSKGVLDAPIFVAECGDPDEGIGDSGNNANSHGTKSSPYASINYALKEVTNADFDYTITIYGDIVDTTPNSGTDPETHNITGITAHSLTLEGYKSEGSNTSYAALIGNGKSTLTVNTTVPVIIKDLMITEGSGTTVSSITKGGGIYLQSGTVKLADGAHITGNTAIDGGGVYVNSGAKLFMYGSSVIGDIKSTTITSAPEDADHASNSAQQGGGIDNYGEVYLGYEDWTNESNNVPHAMTAGYGISHNYGQYNGGGIQNNKIIRMASGTIGLNKGGAGGGIMNDNDDFDQDINKLSGGTIEDNVADCGGGIWSNNPLNLHGNLIIKNNEAIDESGDSGGAIWAYSKVILKDAVFIPYGVNNSKAERKNDVALGDNAKIKIASNLSEHDSTKPVVITPRYWTRGSAVITESDSTILANNLASFATSDDDFTIGQSPTTATNGILKADIYLAGGANTTYKIGTPDDTATTRGTKKYPFKTLKYALQTICNDSNQDYTIKVFGNISGGSEIPGSGFSAKSLTIEGVRGMGYGVNTDPQDYFSGVQTTEPKSALTVNSTVPVTIKKLGMMYGGGTTVASSIYGGGLYIPVDGAHVTLAEDAYVSRNMKGSNGSTIDITYGGGVYLGYGASLYMCQTALVGSRWRTNAQYFSGTINKAANGAGIYNCGYLYLGYKYENGTMYEEALTANDYGIPGGIRSNQNTGTGGGVYIASTGHFKMKSGDITLNEAWYGAGIYSEAASKDDAILEGGYITSNIATHKGSGINIAAGKFFYVKDGTIQSNNNRYTDRLGGAVYCAGTLAIGGNAYFQNGTVAESKNDIAVANTGKIEVESALEKTGTIATLTMEQWTRGYEVLIPGSSLTSGITDAIKSKFVTIDEDFTFDLKGTGAATTGALNAPIYVASTATTDSTRVGNAGVTTGARGTRAKPYASLYSAVAACTDSSLPFTIYVDGTVTGGQTIESTASAPINAKSLTITNRPDAVANTHSAVLSGNNLYRTLDITAPDNDFEITITNLLITGGKPTNGSGGGISLHKGTLKLGSGVIVTGNRASYGGGINVASGASLFIYDDAIVGDTTETIAEYDSSDLSKFGNWAQYCGGGISTNGNVYIGYSGINETTHQLIPSTMTTGGVRRNFCSANGGGGIYVFEGIVEIGSGNVSFNAAGNSGGGIYVQEGTINLDSASISSNNSTSSGGAIYMHNSATCSVNITGSSEIINNSAKNSGGAIYISSTGSLTMTAGTIGGSNSSDANIADSDSDGTGDGGAIYNGGTFNISGTAYIPYGGNEKSNDVCLYGTSTITKTITLKDSLSKHSSDNPIAIVPVEWKRGKQVLSKDSTLSAISDELAAKFITVDPDLKVKVKSGDTSQAIVYGDIYIASTEETDTTRSGNKGVATGARGTRISPYSSFATALATVSSDNNKIIFDGTITGSVSLTSSNVPSGITSLEFEGLVATGAQSSNAVLKGSSGSTLTVNLANATNTVTITNLKITGGAAGTGNGGGINITKGTVKLGDYAKIDGNSASGGKGGGVYVASGSKLLMYGKSLIGDSTNSTTVAQSSYSNTAKYGGAVYNEGEVCLGYSAFTNINNKTESSIDTNYGIRRNNASTSGGGIYSDGGTVYFKTGTVGYNYSAGNGGGFINTSSTGHTGSKINMYDGKIIGNKAVNGGAVYLETQTTNQSSITMSSGSVESNVATTSGGAIYIGAKCSVEITGGQLGGNNLQNTAGTSGGAIYQNGTFILDNSAKLYSGSTKTNDVFLTNETYIYLKSNYSSNSTYAPRITLDTNGYWTFARVIHQYSGTTLPSSYSYISLDSSQLTSLNLKAPNSKGALMPTSTSYSVTTTAEADSGDGIVAKAGNAMASTDNITITTSVPMKLRSFCLPDGAKLTLQKASNFSTTDVLLTGYGTIGQDSESGDCGEFIVKGLSNTMGYRSLMEITDTTRLYNVTLMNNPAIAYTLTGEKYNKGGAIYINASKDVSLHNCKIDNCSASQGGAIYSKANLLEIDNATTISNCKASTDTTRFPDAEGCVLYYTGYVDSTIKLYKSSYNTGNNTATNRHEIYVKDFTSYLYIYWNGSSTASEYYWTDYSYGSWITGP